MNTVEIGRKLEQLVLEYYLQKNYLLVENNFEYRTEHKQGRLGEIDLILEKDNILVIVEVKFRANLKFGNPVEQINKAKMNNIFKSYLYFLSLKNNHKFKQYFARFDVVAIYQDQMKIYKNAYTFDSFNGGRF